MTLKPVDELVERPLSETPELRWFDMHPRCRCGRVAEGVLRGTQNQSYGFHCKRCAEKRLKASAKIRAALSSTQPEDGADSEEPTP